MEKELQKVKLEQAKRLKAAGLNMNPFALEKCNVKWLNEIFERYDLCENWII